MSESLTMNLRMELDRTNAQFNRWVNTQKDWINSNDSHYNNKLEECNVTLYALKENNAQLHSSKSINDVIKLQQQQDIEQCLSQNNLLLKQKDVLEQHLRRCEEDEELENKRLDDARAEHEILRKKMEQSLNDLIYGMRHYTALGLEFQKADSDCMKFIFTQIDEKDPNAKFFFTMFVDGNNLYQLVETKPVLNQSVCIEQVRRLNENNDIGKFVFEMRKLFKKSVLSC